MKAIQCRSFLTSRSFGVGRVLLTPCFPSPNWQGCTLVRPARPRAPMTTPGHSTCVTDLTNDSFAACLSTLPISLSQTAVLGFVPRLQTFPSRSQSLGSAIWRTSWEFFTAHWDDFCYPLSDDVLVLPDSGAWVLRYHHEEVFYFGNRNA
jgi:hypothetical protein